LLDLAVVRGAVEVSARVGDQSVGADLPDLEAADINPLARATRPAVRALQRSAIDGTIQRPFHEHRVALEGHDLPPFESRIGDRDHEVPQPRRQLGLPLENLPVAAGADDADRKAGNAGVDIVAVERRDRGTYTGQIVYRGSDVRCLPNANG